MTERPILFSGPMVRAILDGKKTQTRRVIRDAWWRCLDPEDADDRALAVRQSPYGQPGDTLWVRETWAQGVFGPIWRADWTEDEFTRHTGNYPAHPAAAWLSEAQRVCGADVHKGGWRPSIYMRREDSRLTLRVEAVRVERLQEISEADARAEGVDPVRAGQDADGPIKTYRTGFVRGWDSINGKRAPWSSNPWVWVVTFARLDRIDAALGIPKEESDG